MGGRADHIFVTVRCPLPPPGTSSALEARPTCWRGSACCRTAPPSPCSPSSRAHCPYCPSTLHFGPDGDVPSHPSHPIPSHRPPPLPLIHSPDYYFAAPFFTFAIHSILICPKHGLHQGFNIRNGIQSLDGRCRPLPKIFLILAKPVLRGDVIDGVVVGPSECPHGCVFLKVFLACIFWE